MQDSNSSTAIELPAFCLVVMVGISGSGKSTFTRRHFLPTQILSSDSFRSLVSDDPNDQSATIDAFDSLYVVLEKRLARKRITIIDATNLRPQDRQGYVQLAARFQCPVIAVVLDIPVDECLLRNAARCDRNLEPQILQLQSASLRVHLGGLEQEGFDRVHVFSSSEDIGMTRFFCAWKRISSFPSSLVKP
jgi:predicted kinase